MATSTPPCEGQGQVPPAKPWPPRLSRVYTIKSQFIFPTRPGNGSAPMSDRAALYQYCAGRLSPPAV